MHTIRNQRDTIDRMALADIIVVLDGGRPSCLCKRPFDETCASPPSYRANVLTVPAACKREMRALRQIPNRLKYPLARARQSLGINATGRSLSDGSRFTRAVHVLTAVSGPREESDAAVIETGMFRGSEVSHLALYGRPRVTRPAFTRRKRHSEVLRCREVFLYLAGKMKVALTPDGPRHTVIRRDSSRWPVICVRVGAFPTAVRN